jgi:hypothetical protein
MSGAHASQDSHRVAAEPPTSAYNAGPVSYRLVAAALPLFPRNASVRRAASPCTSHTAGLQIAPARAMKTLARQALSLCNPLTEHSVVRAQTAVGRRQPETSPALSLSVTLVPITRASLAAFFLLSHKMVSGYLKASLLLQSYSKEPSRIRTFSVRASFVLTLH